MNIIANELHLEILKKGTVAWNNWRDENPSIEPDLSGSSLSRMNLSGVNLMMSNLFDVDFSWADLSEANLIEANLDHACLNWAELKLADLGWASLRKAELNYTDLNCSDLRGADLSSADLSFADLTNSLLVETNLKNAILSGCSIYGISAWGLNLEGANQLDLIITPEGEPTITVDNLEVAQFIYLLLNNEKLSQVIDTVTSKVVLILGRFTPERKAVLNTIKNELRRYDYVPVLFDFEKSASRDITETISTLAHMARFVIADITDARSLPQELAHIIPDIPSVPVQPLLQASGKEYCMFEHFKRYPWVLEVHRYYDFNDLLKSLGEKVIDPAERMVLKSRTK